MRPIRDIVDVRQGNVLYHSAFGFARVLDATGSEVAVEWEERAPNLPERIGLDSLRRVWALCASGGFFEQALNAPDALKELLQIDPPRALALLLTDLDGPQRKVDVRDWIVGRGLMSQAAFARWWSALQPLFDEDPRFHVEGDVVSLGAAGDSGAADRLRNPRLSPARRLDLALAHRGELPEAEFQEQVLTAWRTGGQQVRDLAMAAVRDVPADEVLRGLLAPGPDATEALVHAVRRGGWEPSDVSDEVHRQLVERIVHATTLGGPLDSEGRLAATLSRWGAPGILEVLARLAHTVDGQRLLRATFAALPPRRSEPLALDLVELCIAGHGRADGLYWLLAEVLERSSLGAEQLAEAVDADRPVLAAWLRDEYDPFFGDDVAEDEGAQTAELEVSWLSEAVPLGEAQRRTGVEFLRLALSLSRALAEAHEIGLMLHPTADSVQIHADDTATVSAGSANTSPRPEGELSTPASDIYAMAVLMVGWIAGRPWPRELPAWQALPYLRQVVHELPPSALGPLEAALHPDPLWRPRNGRDWLALWQAAIEAEDARVGATRDAARLTLGFDSHVGRAKLLLTQTNQDALFVATRDELSLFLVCDGISTATAGSGDVASNITAHLVANLWEQAHARLAEATPDETREFLSRALRMANQAVCEAALRFAGGSIAGRVPMGTTSVACAARGNRVTLAWLGDSRAYLVGPYGASLLTADMNQAGDRMRSWAAGRSDRWDPNGFALTGYVGHFDDLHRPAPLDPLCLHVVLLPGERLVLCTDGVTDFLGDIGPDVSARIARRAREGTPDEAARGLVELANRGGGGDNATAVVAEVNS